MNECITESESIIVAGTWFQDDDLSELRANLYQRNASGVKSPYPIADATAITLEFRSEDTGAEFDKAWTVDDVPTSEVVMVDPGSGWTSPAGRTTETFLGYTRVTKGAVHGHCADVLRITFRTAP